MNADHVLTYRKTYPDAHHGWLGDALLLPDVDPAPRPSFWGVTPYHQPVTPADTKRFLDRTHNAPGHTFTEHGRS